ncbi:hypothetical protein [Tateyamaria sp. SN6-1]|uniref:hypothetical protein n=1 Tax=Tateyamaria sp. SN6-1 TaxID=3092148 RepID=UPI0039F5888F
MIGVILWSDPAAEKAVIWCEDHGDLAFLSRPDAVQLPEGFVDVGDVVEFDISARKNTRLAKNVTVVSESKGTDLVEQLKSAPPPPAMQASHTAEVIPFRLDAPIRRTAPNAPQVQRRG